MKTADLTVPYAPPCSVFFLKVFFLGLVYWLRKQWFKDVMIGVLGTRKTRRGHVGTT